MPGHLLVPGLTGGMPATWSAAALTGLLRGELGFTGAIVSDALEMRAVSDPLWRARGSRARGHGGRRPALPRP